MPQNNSEHHWNAGNVLCAWNVIDFEPTIPKFKSQLNYELQDQFFFPTSDRLTYKV